MNGFKLGSFARLTVKNPAALDNPVLHAVPHKLMLMQETDAYMPNNQRWMVKA